MKKFCLFMIAAISVFAENFYEEHLPEELYDFFIEEQLLDPSQTENITEKPLKETITTITVRIEDSRWGKEWGHVKGWGHVEVSLSFKEDIDGIKKISYAYSNKTLLAFTFIDKQGKDYFEISPLEPDLEKNTVFRIKTLITSGIDGLISAAYQQHLPEELYATLLKEQILDPTKEENSIQKDYNGSVDTITLKFDELYVKNDDGEEEALMCVALTYRCEEEVNGTISSTIHFSDKKIVQIAYLDKEGTIYPVEPITSEAEQKETIEEIANFVTIGARAAYE
ncbi:hypothetical protein K0U07_04435 [bacterium]|nr:hypothetical protein [bacterium]